MIVSVICDTRDTCSLRALFVWPLHLFLTLYSNCSRSELHCSFSFTHIMYVDIASYFTLGYIAKI